MKNILLIMDGLDYTVGVLDVVQFVGAGTDELQDVGLVTLG